MFTSLFDFIGHEVKLLGQVNLPLSLGGKPLRITCIITFMVIEAVSAYSMTVDEFIQRGGINVPSDGQIPNRWTSRRGLRKSSHRKEVLCGDDSC